MSAVFIGSEGWNWNEPKANHRRDPLTVVPMTATATNKRRSPPQAKGPSFTHFEYGTKAAWWRIADALERLGVSEDCRGEGRQS